MNPKKKLWNRLATFCLPLAFSVACGSAPGTTSAESNLDETAETAFDGAVDAEEAPAGEPTGCGDVELSVKPMPSRLLILLDRSCSMNGKLTTDASSIQSKWQIALKSVETMAEEPNGPQLALSFFPSVTKGDEKVDVPFGPASNDEVVATLTAAGDEGNELYPGSPCCTPIDRATVVAQATQALRAEGIDGSVVLITDGSQVSCGDAYKQGGMNGAIANVASMLADHGIQTYVVGFGGKVSKGNLNDLAQAGGTDLAPDDSNRRFYTAESSSELNQALSTISDEAVSCSVKVSGISPLPEDEALRVELDGTELELDPNQTEGWGVTGTDEITLFGSACDEFKTGKPLRVVAPCPPVPR